ncbi:MAG: SUMF1/EgtB/PvdO family nonheme iron enzyme [Clostridia bacterium]
MNKKKMRVGAQIKAQKGITLIALIITIIVMLILVGVTITVAVNGGLFEYAGRAGKETNEAITEEKMLAEGKIKIDGFWYDSMDDYLNGIYSENQPNAGIKLTYTLRNTDFTKGAVGIYVTPELKDYIDYVTWGKNVLSELENSITDANELKTAKENLLLEGINYWDINDEWWTGEGFDSLQNFVDYINEQDDTEYTDIYALMAAWNGSDEGDTDEQILDDFLLHYGDYYIKPEEYVNYENTHAKITITNPDGTTQEIWHESINTYQVTENGNYTFTATNENGDKGAITVKVNNIIEEKFSSIYSKTELYTDEDGDTAWIPEGFAVGVESVNTTINKVSEGLVITDEVDSEGKSIGNEFVWVPVEITSTDTKISISAMERTLWENNEPVTGFDTRYTEPYSNGYEEEEDEYYDMLESVFNHGGFYIGRYEAGSETPRYDTSNKTTVMSVKRGKYPYNYVGWGSSMSNYTGEITYNSKNQGKGALLLSKELYGKTEDEGKYGVISTLIYGSQWDATLRYIKDTVDVTNSINWGNYNDSTFKFNGKYNTNASSNSWYTSLIDTTKYNNYSRLLTTGASETNKAKNIYDLAGNVWEWTNEAVSSSGRVSRGGGYNDVAYRPSASSRSTYAPTDPRGHIGFRPALYITNE